MTQWVVSQTKSSKAPDKFIKNKINLSYFVQFAGDLTYHAYAIHYKL
jgi:hypothetical protein